MILNITEKTYIKILQIDVRKAEYEIQILMKCIPAGIQGVIKNILTEKNQQIFREEAAEEKKTVLRTTEEVREAALAPAEERHRKETVPRIEDEAAQAEIILLIQEEAKAVIRLETADRAAEPEDRDVSYYDDVYEEPVDTYDDFERRQQRKRQMDIENMADYDDLKSTEATDTEDYDEWKDN